MFGAIWHPVTLTDLHEPFGKIPEMFILILHLTYCKFEDEKLLSGVEGEADKEKQMDKCLSRSTASQESWGGGNATTANNVIPMGLPRACMHRSNAHPCAHMHREEEHVHEFTHVIALLHTYMQMNKYVFMEMQSECTHVHIFMCAFMQ